MAKIWKIPFTLDDLNSRAGDTLIGHLGIQYTEIGDDYLVATMPVDHRTIQPVGILHGGASVVLAETLGSLAAALALNAPVVGIEVNANHLKSVSEGHVTGKVIPIRMGRKIQVWEIRISNEKGCLLYTSPSPRD